MKNLAAILVITLLAFGCTNQEKQANSDDKNKSELSGKISISGAFALYPLTVQWAEQFKKLHPKVQIDISAGGAGKGMTDVLAGMVDIAMFSREVSEAEVQNGAWYIAVAKDAVFPTCNIENPHYQEIIKRGLTKGDFSLLFLNDKPKTWNDILKNKSNIKINVYTRSDACGAAEMWAKYMDKKQEDLKGTGIFGDPGIAQAVKNDKLGIGYNNLTFAYNIKTKTLHEGLAIIPIDLNEDGKITSDENFYSHIDTVIAAIQKGKYPSPPARNLYFISKGEPNKQVVKEFIKYVMTKGQEEVLSSGYVLLDSTTYSQEIKKIGL
ncbi:MAG: extracellular solute-binding protein [Bacteroidales bacterium]